MKFVTYLVRALIWFSCMLIAGFPIAATEYGELARGSLLVYWGVTEALTIGLYYLLLLIPRTMYRRNENPIWAVVVYAFMFGILVLGSSPRISGRRVEVDMGLGFAYALAVFGTFFLASKISEAWSSRRDAAELNKMINDAASNNVSTIDALKGQIPDNVFAVCDSLKNDQQKLIERLDFYVQKKVIKRTHATILLAEYSRKSDVK